MELFTHTGVSGPPLQGPMGLERLCGAGPLMMGVFESDQRWSKLPGPTSGRCFVPSAPVPAPQGKVSRSGDAAE